MSPISEAMFKDEAISSSKLGVRSSRKMDGGMSFCGRLYIQLHDTNNITTTEGTRLLERIARVVVANAACYQTAREGRFGYYGLCQVYGIRYTGLKGKRLRQNRMAGGASKKQA